MSKWICSCGFSNRPNVEFCKGCNLHWSSPDSKKGKSKSGVVSAAKQPSLQPSSLQSVLHTLGGQDQVSSSKLVAWSPAESVQHGPTVQLMHSSKHQQAAALAHTAAATATMTTTGHATASTGSQQAGHLNTQAHVSTSGQSALALQIQALAQKLQHTCIVQQCDLATACQTMAAEQVPAKSLQAKLHAEANRLGKAEKRVKKLEEILDTSNQAWQTHLQTERAKLLAAQASYQHTVHLAQQELKQAKEEVVSIKAEIAQIFGPSAAQVMIPATMPMDVEGIYSSPCMPAMQPHGPTLPVAPNIHTAQNHPQPPFPANTLTVEQALAGLGNVATAEPSLVPSLQPAQIPAQPCRPITPWAYAACQASQAEQPQPPPPQLPGPQYLAGIAPPESCPHSVLPASSHLAQTKDQIGQQPLAALPIATQSMAKSSDNPVSPQTMKASPAISPASPAPASPPIFGPVTPPPGRWSSGSEQKSQAGDISSPAQPITPCTNAWPGTPDTPGTQAALLKAVQQAEQELQPSQPALPMPGLNTIAQPLSVEPQATAPDQSALLAQAPGTMTEPCPITASSPTQQAAALPTSEPMHSANQQIASGQTEPQETDAQMTLWYRQVLSALQYQQFQQQQIQQWIQQQAMTSQNEQSQAVAASDDGAASPTPATAHVDVGGLPQLPPPATPERPVSIASSSPGTALQRLETAMSPGPAIFNPAVPTVPENLAPCYATGDPAGLTTPIELSRVPKLHKMHSGSVHEQHQQGIVRPMQAVGVVPVQVHSEDENGSNVPTEVASQEDPEEQG